MTAALAHGFVVRFGFLQLTPWYHAGSAKGISSPNGSCDSPVAILAFPEAGLGAAFFGAGAGAGSAFFLVSSDPICS